MVRDNMMKILVGVAVVAGLLTAYNAFFNSNDNADQTATGRLTSYLSLDRAQQESESADTNVVGTDNANNSSTEAEPEAPAAEPEQPAATPEPSAPAPAETTEPEKPAANDEPVAVAPQTPSGDKPETIYTVAEGDTYACIAEKYYGSYEHYVEVMNANPVNWEGFSEYELHVGAKIVLPAIAQAALKTPSSRCN